MHKNHDTQPVPDPEPIKLHHTTLLRALLNAIQASAFLMDADGTIIQANETLAATLHTTVEQLVGSCAYTHIPAALALQRKQHVEQVVRTRQPVRFEDSWEGRYIDHSIYPVLDDEGTVTMLAVFGLDRTESHIAEQALRESEARYRAVVEEQTELICRFFPDGTLTFVNEAYSRYFDTPREDLIGTSFFSLIPPTDREAARTHIASLSQEHPTATYEHRVVLPDGTLCWQQWTDRAIFNSQGTLTEIQSVGRDITERVRAEEALQAAHDKLEQRVAERTAELHRSNNALREEIGERKRVEEALRKSQQLLENTFTSIKDAVFILDASTGTILDCNPAACEIFGYDRDDIIGQQPDTLHVDAAHVDAFRQHLYAAMQQQDYLLLPEFQMKRRDGTVFPTEHSVMALENKQGERIGWVSFVRDMTDIKRAEATYHTLVEHSLQGLVIFQDGRVVYSNPAMSSIMGYSREELLAFSPEQIQARMHPEDRAMILHNWQQRLLGEPAPSPYECRIIHKDGGIRWVELAAVLTSYQDRPAIQAAFLDITERRIAEGALRESEERYRTLVETSPDAIVMTNLEGVIHFCNQRAVQLFGYTSVEELCGRHGYDLVDNSHQTADPLVLVQQFLQSGELRNIEYTMCRQDGSRFPAEVSSSIVTDKDGSFSALIMVVRDMSERKQLQARIIESERFAASGRLAASVAHEINTPLQSLQTSLEMIEIASSEDRTAFLHYALDELQRVGRIVRQLLDLYRPGAAQRGPVEINNLIERLLLLIGKRIRDQRVLVDCALSPDMPTLLARADELMQVLLNLLVNALDAMPEGGTLHITTRVQDTQEPPLAAREAGNATPTSTARQAPRPGQSCIIIEIRDTGWGIADDVRERIFEPFVTTKDHGTGLGLAISNQIVQRHGGHITVESQPHAGSTFSVCLPLKTV